MRCSHNCQQWACTASNAHVRLQAIEYLNISGLVIDFALYGHFGPRTLRHLYLVPKCPGHFGTDAEVSEDTSAPVPK